MNFLKGLFGMPYPGIHHIDSVINNDTMKRVDIGGGQFKYVPCRPLGYPSLRSRFRLAWKVFTGKADALVWEKQ